MRDSIQPSAKEELLGFKKTDLEELWDVKRDFYFYEGRCKDEDAAILDKALLGQSWVSNPNVDYIPTIDIRNKVKALLNKQKRFMFGVEPTITLKPMRDASNDDVEDLTAFIISILDANGFWKDLQQAFLSATIKKKVLLRVEANPGMPINIFFEEVEQFNYVTSPMNYKKIEKVVLVKRNPVDEEDDIEGKHQWIRYTYYMNPKTNTCWLHTEIYNNDAVDRPADEESNDDTRLSQLPAWLIVNGGTLGNTKGESDIADLMEIQNQYNRKISDFGDALRFQMFGETYIIDGTPESVNKLRIAPNSLSPVVSLDERRKASVVKAQSPFTSATPTESYLDRAEKDMYEMLAIPRPEQLANVPSGKAMKYLYTELIGRCEEKWNDWGITLENLVYFIHECCVKLRCYEDWDINWDNVKFKVQIKHNYPIPEDEEVKKEIALKEVEANVRSRESYIQDFTETEDSEGTWIRILDEMVQLQSAQQDNFEAQLNEELGKLETQQATPQLADDTQNLEDDKGEEDI